VPEAPFDEPIKPFEQRPITASPRRNSAPPLPPFSKDRPSSPPFFKDRPSSPPPAPGAASKGAAGSAPPPARNIAIARPDSPSVRAVPRTPTARPPDPFARPAPAAASPVASSASGAEAPTPSGAEAGLASPAAVPPAASTLATATPATADPSALAPSAAPPAAPAPPPSVRPAPASQRPPRDTLPPMSAKPTAPEIEALIEQLVQGNPRAVQDLTRIGAATVPQLMAHFPGPVVSERAGPSSRASECGPLLQTLASIGSPALPDITRSTEDHDARVRRWATLLLGEMPGPEACRAVVQRLADDVPRVHQAALDAARLLLSSSAANLFRKTLFEVAEAEDAPLTLRLRTLEHVARLRDSASVPRLIAFLALDTEPVVHKALWALTVITRQDFGRDAQSWGDWWQAHQSKHRFQWLIEALDHRDPRLRKAAGDELLIEAKDSFGYAENLSEPERLAAQRRYQEWWENTGARRFGRLQ
jgi:HEAT repeats